MNAMALLNEHLDQLFENAPPSRAAYELREELMANSLERFEDLVQNGMPQEEAFQTVIANIGNVDELLAALPAQKGPVSPAWEDELRARRAQNNTIAIGLYLFAGVVLIVSLLLGMRFGSVFAIGGLGITLALCIIPTCILVYTAYRWPKYDKREDTVVEDFKKWSNDSKKAKSIRGAISSLIWMITLIAYFLISFSTMAWHITWIIFLAASCLEAVITLMFGLKK